MVHFGRNAIQSLQYMVRIYMYISVCVCLDPLLIMQMHQLYIYTHL